MVFIKIPVWAQLTRQKKTTQMVWNSMPSKMSWCTVVLYGFFSQFKLQTLPSAPLSIKQGLMNIFFPLKSTKYCCALLTPILRYTHHVVVVKPQKKNKNREC